MSKGSKQRPKQISDEEMSKRWDKIFKRSNKDESATTPKSTDLGHTKWHR